MPCRRDIGIEIVQGTICKDRSRARVTIGYPETIPVGRPSLIYVKVEWGLAEAGRVLRLELQRRTESGGDDIRFDGPDGGHILEIEGDAERLVAIFGRTAQAGEELNTHLNIQLDEDEYGVDPPIEIVPLAAETVPTGEAASAILQREVAIALRPTRATEAAEQGIWDRYAAIHEDAYHFAGVIETTEIGQAGVPLLPREEAQRRTAQLGGEPGSAATLPASLVPIEPDLRDFDRPSIVAHLRSNRDPEALANLKAQGKNNAFDRFQGHWRGRWRQKQDIYCAGYFSACWDHELAETRRLEADSTVWIQSLVMGPDSRAAAATSADCAAMEAARDTDTSAVSAIDIATGLIVGAVGVKPAADDDGVQAMHPRIGFYVDHGRLLWVVEEGREGQIVTYSIVSEVSVGEDDQPVNDQRYVVMAFRFRWDRTQRQIVGEIETSAGQYLKLLTEAQQQLENDYRAHRLQQAHLDDMRYRRRLEFSHPDVIQAFLDHPGNAGRRGYLEPLLEFTRQQEALRTAPLGKRESITFIMGGVDDRFYASATRYFELNPSTHVESLAGDSLRDLRDHLVNHPPQTPAPQNERRWGEVNMVSHANEWGNMTVPLTPGGDSVSDDTLRDAIAHGTFPTVPDVLFDVRTRFYVRGCEIGRSQDFVDAMSEALGKDDADDLQRPQVYAPKHLQTFRFWTVGNDLVAADQYLEQSWYVVYPLNENRTQQQLRDMFVARHGNVLDWQAALGRRHERYLGDTYYKVHPDPDDPDDDPITLTFTFQHANAATLPQLSTPQQRRQWANGQAGLVSWVQGLGLAMDDLQWNVQNDAAALTTTAEGLGSYVDVHRGITAELQPIFDVDSGFGAALDRRDLTPDLWAEFAANDHALGRQAFVTLHWVGNLWLITDPENLHTYALRRGSNHIEVSLEGPSPAPPNPLFNIPAAANTRNSLNSFIVPAVLRNGFPAASRLSANVAVIRDVEHQRWLLLDQDNARIYAVSREGATLNVYAQPQAAHPPFTDPAFFGMQIPARPPEHVWGENVQP